MKKLMMLGMFLSGLVGVNAQIGGLVDLQTGREVPDADSRYVVLENTIVLPSDLVVPGNLSVTGTLQIAGEDISVVVTNILPRDGSEAMTGGLEVHAVDGIYTWGDVLTDSLYVSGFNHEPFNGLWTHDGTVANDRPVYLHTTNSMYRIWYNDDDRWEMIDDGDWSFWYRSVAPGVEHPWSVVDWTAGASSGTPVGEVDRLSLSDNVALVRQIDATLGTAAFTASTDYATLAGDNVFTGATNSFKDVNVMIASGFALPEFNVTYFAEGVAGGKPSYRGRGPDGQTIVWEVGSAWWNINEYAVSFEDVATPDLVTTWRAIDNTNTVLSGTVIAGRTTVGEGGVTTVGDVLASGVSLTNVHAVADAALPKTAGSDHILTGDLYLGDTQNPITSTAALRLSLGDSSTNLLLVGHGRVDDYYRHRNRFFIGDTMYQLDVNYYPSENKIDYTDTDFVGVGSITAAAFIQDGTNLLTEIQGKVSLTDAEYTNTVALAGTAWQNPSSVTNFTWTTNNNEITLESWLETGSTNVVIPDYINGLPVTAIGALAFSPGGSGSAVTSVGGGANVTSIGIDAFSSCTSLTSVVLPSATSIGVGAFYGCTNLVSISLPAATSIGDSAFESCTSLTTVNLPSATSIGAYAFFNCTSLTNVTFSGNAPDEGIGVYLSSTNVINYVTNPTATDWGTLWNDQPVVRLGVTADSFTLGTDTITEWPSDVDLSGYVQTNHNGNVSISGALSAGSVSSAGIIETDTQYLFDGVNAVRLYKGIDTFYSSVAVGEGAGEATTGGGDRRQTAMGYWAGRDNSGVDQTAMGYWAGRDNSGAYQTAIGAGAGRDNSGAAQTAMGYWAGRDNSGAYQTAIGAGAGNDNSGAYQTAMGYRAGRDNSGDYQTALGYEAGRFIADGSTANTNSANAVYLGANTRSLTANDDNIIVIGTGAIGKGSNTAVWGNTDIERNYFSGDVEAESYAITGNRMRIPDAITIPTNATYTLSYTNGAYQAYSFGAGTADLTIDLEGPGADYISQQRVYFQSGYLDRPVTYTNSEGSFQWINYEPTTDEAEFIIFWTGTNAAAINTTVTQ